MDCLISFASIIFRLKDRQEGNAMTDSICLLGCMVAIRLSLLGSCPRIEEVKVKTRGREKGESEDGEREGNHLRIILLLH